ncbi:hypothetical protein ITP53_40760 [Nonomuraea sp. K274]|uniref:Uncharacterized protein n=1 Tax=Nonomuraea cypriaca TaxID=1187855 RepID=A0A931AFC4_9ACTN|nr:hypothetical protein [Nonomuraea cypriaca]
MVEVADPAESGPSSENGHLAHADQASGQTSYEAGPGAAARTGTEADAPVTDTDAETDSNTEIVVEGVDSSGR